ncbi:MAG TPA: sugar nucleotide-binding protein [Bdellovibrionota bacterium]|jgi:dTDP-4-dehydrorhamnose reductase
MKSKPKVFIAGISGLLGNALGWHLRKDFLVSGACFTNQVLIPDTQIFPISLKNTEMLEALVRMQQPDFVINAVGMSDRKEVEAQPKVSDLVNIMLPVSLGILSGRLKAKYINLGCGEVFDGEKGGYKEDDTDFTLHDSVGKQKITALSYVRAQTMESTNLRVGRVLGVGHPHRSSFFDRIRSFASSKKIFEASKRKSRSYISIRSFLNAAETVLKGEFPARHRLFHVGGANMTEFELVESWYNLMGSDPKLVQELQDAKRDLTMVSGLMESQYASWKAENKSQLFWNLIQELSPGVGAKKWQKTLQIP